MFRQESRRSSSRTVCWRDALPMCLRTTCLCTLVAVSCVWLLQPNQTQPNSTSPTSLPTVHALPSKTKSWRAARGPQCHDDGREWGHGCQGHMCFIGRCLCSKWGDRKAKCHGAPNRSEHAGLLSLSEGSMNCNQWWPTPENRPSVKIADFRYSRYDWCQFYQADWGVVRVSKKRWRIAQRFESGGP